MDLWWNMIKAIVDPTTRHGGRTARFQIFSKDFADICDEKMKEMAEEFRIRLITNITTQKFASSFPSLSDYWKEWKSEHGAESGFWQAWGDLTRSLSVRKTPKGYSVGVEPGLFASSSTSILESDEYDRYGAIWRYMFYNEFGRRAFSKNGFSVKAQPARPNIGLTRAEMGPDFWTAKMKNDFHKKVKAAFLKG